MHGAGKCPNPSRLFLELIIGHWTRGIWVDVIGALAGATMASGDNGDGYVEGEGIVRLGDGKKGVVQNLGNTKVNFVKQWPSGGLYLQ